MEIVNHESAAALAAAVAERIAGALDQAMAERQQALLALAGGRTSPPIFRQLTQTHRDWIRVTLVPSDERWVAADHVDNNLQQMRAAFADASGIQCLSLVPDDPQGEVDAGFANAALAKHPELFDVAMLGMGADGHFASLFPGAPHLAEALATDAPPETLAAVAIVPDPMPIAGPHPRISLTLARLLHSRLLLLVITGEDKRAVLMRALAEGDSSKLPVAALVRAQHAQAEIHWSP